MLLHSKILGEGIAMIILHGFLGMGDNWKTLGKRFSSEGYEVHLVDQRNHGRSFHDHKFNYDLLVQDLKDYCMHYQLSDIILIGHSMGGKTAMLFGLKHTDLVSKLIVADIAPRYYPVQHAKILEGLSALNFDIINTRNEADEVLSNYINEFSSRQFLLRNLYWIEKGRLALRVNLKVLNESVDEIGEAISSHLNYDKESLFLKGDRSDYISIQDENLIKDLFPKASIVTIKNSGHWLHAENPNDFFEAVINFIM